MEPTRKLSSLQSQTILSFLLAVFLTAAVGGLPTLWLIRQQMDGQAWAQVDQAQHAALAQYEAWQERLLSLARLTAQRPTLARLLGQGDAQGLEGYLETLRSGEGVDLILVCDGEGQPAAATMTELYDTDGLCRLPQGWAYAIDSTHVPPHVWLLAASPLEATGGGGVVVGLHLDEAFTQQMKGLTGLEHTLFVDGLAAVSSTQAQPQNLVTVAPGLEAIATPPQGVCCTFELDESPYYAARLPLGSAGVSDGAVPGVRGLEFEVALPVAGIAATQRRLFLFIALSVVLVALIGSLIGILLARRISRPLVQLAGEADRLSTGDLDTPITVDSQINEVVQVSRALEGARSDLAHTLANLQKEKAWVNHLLESIVEGIVTLDERCRIRFFSHGAERMTGWSRAEVIGKRCDEVFKLVGDGGAFSESLPTAGQRTRLLVDLPGERQVTLSITRAELSPPGAGGGEVALVFRDVSETETIRRLLGYFLANVTHEFRTPLSALAASIELLMDQAPDLTQAEMDELLKSLHLGVLGLQTLVDNLLESASIEAGHFRVSPRTYDLEAIIIDAVGTMQPLLDKYEQQLYVDLPDDLPEVMADPRRVAQVLVNLLSNASKYGPSDAEIILSARQEGPSVRVEVADRGPGISSLHRELLFRRFEYPEVDTPSKVGAGLGLSVVKTIIEAHGGHAGVENRLGGGSIFWFTLPVVREI